MQTENLAKKINNSQESVVQKMQDEIYKKMTAQQKVKLVSEFFRFGKKLNALNDRRKKS